MSTSDDRNPVDHDVDEESVDRSSVDENSTETRAGAKALAGDRSPKQPDPQDEAGESALDMNADRTDDAADDDETPVERYRDSPGIGVDKSSGDVPEPNEPG